MVTDDDLPGHRPGGEQDQAEGGTMTERLICTVSTGDPWGTVVRWYFPNDPMAGNPAVEPVLAASREGVRVGVYLHQVPYLEMEHAKALHRKLEAEPDVYCGAVATHHFVKGVLVALP